MTISLPPSKPQARLSGKKESPTIEGLTPCSGGASFIAQGLRGAPIFNALRCLAIALRLLNSGMRILRFDLDPLLCRVETVMSALPLSHCALSCFVICLLVVNSPASAAPAVGTVTRVQNQAQIGATATPSAPRSSQGVFGPRNIRAFVIQPSDI